MVKICVSYLTCSKKKKRNQNLCRRDRSIGVIILCSPLSFLLLNRCWGIWFRSPIVTVILDILTADWECIYKKKPFLLKAADYVPSSIYNGHKTSLKLLEIWQSNQLYIVHVHVPAVEIYTCIFLHVTEVFSKAMPSHTSHLHLCVNGRIGNFDLHVLANLTYQTFSLV